MHTMTEASERVLSTAEALFMHRGYRSVRLQEIADKLGCKTASLYHHAPGGKSDLYQQVVRRSLKRHQDAIEAVVQNEPYDLKIQLLKLCAWLHSQPRMSISLMMEDLEHLELDDRRALEEQAYASILLPIAHCFRHASERGELIEVRPELLASSFLAIVDVIRQSAELPYTVESAEEMSSSMIDILIRGASRDDHHRNEGFS